MDDKSKRSIAISKIMGFIAIGMAMLTVTVFMVALYYSS